jgi:hypothetical protein
LSTRNRVVILAMVTALFLCSACWPGKSGPTNIETDPTQAEPEPFTAPFVDHLLFGYWLGEPFASDWVETQEIRHVPGRNFGWRIKLVEPHGRYVTIIERMNAPEPVDNWGRLDERHLVAPDRQVATVPNSLKVRDGWIHRSNWTISEADPMGTYQLEVQINGRMALRLYFDLVVDDSPIDPDAPEPVVDDEVDEGPAAP